MEQGATITNDKNAVLTVDDLVMKIGLLTVEKLELEKRFANMVKMEEDYKRLVVREQDLVRQLSELSKRYNEVVELLNKEQLKVVKLEKELESIKDKEIKGVSSDYKDKKRG